MRSFNFFHSDLLSWLVGTDGWKYKNSSKISWAGTRAFSPIVSSFAFTAALRGNFSQKLGCKNLIFMRSLREGHDFARQFLKLYVLWHYVSAYRPKSHQLFLKIFLRAKSFEWCGFSREVALWHVVFRR